MKILSSVDEDAIDARGFHGTFNNPGGVLIDPVPGTVVLERIASKPREHVLWVLDDWVLDEGMEWTHVACDDSAGWAVILGDEARELLGQSITEEEQDEEMTNFLQEVRRFTLAFETQVLANEIPMPERKAMCRRILNYIDDLFGR